jgi:phytoene desaturase
VSGAPERVDALVLGAGFAGLSAAVELALGGAEVLVVERAAGPGGKAGEIREGGFRFDTGPSVVTLPHVLTAPFEATGRPFPLPLRPLDLLARYRFASGRVLDVHRDVDATTAQLDADEARAYRDLLEEARALYEAAAPVFVHGPHPGPVRLARYGLRHGLRARPWARLPDLLAAHGAQGELRDLFLRFATYFGADPFRAPAVLHNIAWVELGLGVVAPEGGVAGLVRAYEGLARDLGVRFRYGEEVVALRPRRNGAPEVTTRTAEDERTLRPSRLLSSLDRDRTARLAGLRPPGAGAEPSLSGMVLLLAIEGEHDEVAHHTLSMPADYEAEFAAMRAGRAPIDPTLYLAVGARVRADDAPEGAENWFVMANAPALGRDGHGIDEAAYADAIHALLIRRGWLRPGEARRVAALGPRHLAGLASRGAIYGAAPHSLLATLRPSQALRGLARTRLAGGTVHPGGGIPLAVLSGRRAAQALLGRRATG